MRNLAGDHDYTDGILRQELKEAGIHTLQEECGKPPEYLADMLRRNSGEVKTSVIGFLHGWEFKRAWCYWTVKGQGIPVAEAEELHRTHGKVVRVAGHCGCPSPREWYKGFPVTDYHVDTQEGLNALASLIRRIATTEPDYKEEHY